MHFKLCVCLHGLFVHGLTCSSASSKTNGFNFIWTWLCSVLDICLNPQKYIEFPDYSTRQWAWSWCRPRAVQWDRKNYGCLWIKIWIVSGTVGPSYSVHRFHWFPKEGDHVTLHSAALPDLVSTATTAIAPNQPIAVLPLGHPWLSLITPTGARCVGFHPMLRSYQPALSHLTPCVLSQHFNPSVRTRWF